MQNAWTGGQYSVYRTMLATCLLIQFLQSLFFLLSRTESSLLAAASLMIGFVLCFPLAIGWGDRVATVGLLFVLAHLLARGSPFANASLPFIALALSVHLFTPSAPYASWAARGRVDPGGDWCFPPALFAAVWIALSLGYVSSGVTKLRHLDWRDGAWIVPGFEMAFPLLALVPRLRPGLWSMMLLMQLALLGDFGIGLVLFHLLAFDPGWIRPLTGNEERLFYDGYCGLCQRSVRLILAEDTTGTAFRFSPLQGETFQSLLPAHERENLPMSVVIRTETGALLTRSSGVLHVLRRLGGLWRILAGLLTLIPRPLRDRLYDGAARIRHRLFAQPTETCPLLPPQLRMRFDP